MTFPVTKRERSFSKVKIVKTFLRNSINELRVNDLAPLSIESSQAEGIDLECFVDEFDSRRIKMH